MREKLSISLKVTLALFVATFSSGLLPVATAYATTADNSGVITTEAVTDEKEVAVEQRTTVAEENDSETLATPKVTAPAAAREQSLNLNELCVSRMVVEHEDSECGMDEHLEECDIECGEPCLINGQVSLNGTCVELCTLDNSCNPPTDDKCPLIDGDQTDTTLCPPTSGNNGGGNNGGGTGGGTPTTPPAPVTPTVPQVLGTSTTATTTGVLPATLPATGGESRFNPLMIVIASAMAYGATYFVQNRRLLKQQY